MRPPRRRCRRENANSGGQLGGRHDIARQGRDAGDEAAARQRAGRGGARPAERGAVRPRWRRRAPGSERECRLGTCFRVERCLTTAIDRRRANGQPPRVPPRMAWNPAKIVTSLQWHATFQCKNMDNGMARIFAELARPFKSRIGFRVIETAVSGVQVVFSSHPGGVCCYSVPFLTN